MLLMTLRVGCKDNKSSYMMVVEDIVDREVIILEVLPSKLSNRWAPGTVLENARQSLLYGNTWNMNWC